MSRVDEALSRAGNRQPESVGPMILSADDIAFVSEPEVATAPTPPAPAERSPEPPPEAERTPAPERPRPQEDAQPAAEVEPRGLSDKRATVAEPLIVEPPIVEPSAHDEEVDEDLRQTPLAEKLNVTSGDPTSIEQYRRLAGRLYLAQAERGTRVVMVTSAMPGEGKTLTATNVALTLAESYKRQVLLIDADLRRPWVHEMFQVPNLSGLNDGLRSADDHKIPLLRLTDHLSILTAGRPDRDPMSVLSSDRMRRVVQEASARFDWVIIDTPPVALLTDAHLLASLVDAVLLVIQSGKTPLAAINKAVEAVGRERILGVVLNRADHASVYRAYDYYGAYEPSTALEKVK